MGTMCCLFGKESKREKESKKKDFSVVSETRGRKRWHAPERQT